MNAQRSEHAMEGKVGASRWTFMKLMERSHLHNIKVQGEAASDDIEVATRYSDVSKIIKGD